MRARGFFGFLPVIRCSSRRGRCRRRRRRSSAAFRRCDRIAAFGGDRRCGRGGRRRMRFGELHLLRSGLLRRERPRIDAGRQRLRRRGVLAATRGGRMLLPITLRDPVLHLAELERLDLRVPARLGRGFGGFFLRGVAHLGQFRDRKKRRGHQRRCDPELLSHETGSFLVQVFAVWAAVAARMPAPDFRVDRSAGMRPARTSSYQYAWWSRAQVSSTQPSRIARYAPCMPIVPM